MGCPVFQAVDDCEDVAGCPGKVANNQQPALIGTLPSSQARNDLSGIASNVVRRLGCPSRNRAVRCGRRSGLSQPSDSHLRNNWYTAIPVAIADSITIAIAPNRLPSDNTRPACDRVL